MVEYVVEDVETVIRNAIFFCEDLLDKYDEQQEITDSDIIHLMHILHRASC